MLSRLADPLTLVLQRIDPQRRLQAYRLWEFWDEVVGEQIARRAQPQRIRDGVLVVTVSSHTWMQELQLLKEAVRERINERLGAALIADIYLVSGSIKRATPPAAAAASPPVAVPDLPTTGLPELDAALARAAHAAARRSAEAAAPRKRKRRRTKN